MLVSLISYPSLPTLVYENLKGRGKMKDKILLHTWIIFFRINLPYSLHVSKVSQIIASSAGEDATLTRKSYSDIAAKSRQTQRSRRR